MKLALRWPALTLRSTVLLAIVVGVVLPAFVVLAIDGIYTRRAQEPVIERNRGAVMVLANAVITEPAWTLSEAGLAAAADRIVQEPSVWCVEVLELQPNVAPLTRKRDHCVATKASTRESPVLHEGQQIARLRLGFDPLEVDRAIAERRTVTAWLVAAQVLLGVGVLAGVLSLRLLRPIDELKRQAGRIAGREPQPPHAWPQRDELGQLGQHLNSVHAQIAGLIGELEAKNTELRRLAMHDPLTGRPNRLLLRELFAHEVSKARRDGSTFAVVYVDLDDFKSVNDTHSHAAGDALLVAVGVALRSVLRESDVVCRLGGDEFLVLLPRVQGEAALAATIERLRQALAMPHPLPPLGALVAPRATLGVAAYPTDGEDLDALLRIADQAMYRGKAARRQRGERAALRTVETLRQG